MLVMAERTSMGSNSRKCEGQACPEHGTECWQHGYPAQLQQRRASPPRFLLQEALPQAVGFLSSARDWYNDAARVTDRAAHRALRGDGLGRSVFKRWQGHLTPRGL